MAQACKCECQAIIFPNSWQELFTAKSFILKKCPPEDILLSFSFVKELVQFPVTVLKNFLQLTFYKKHVSQFSQWS